MKLRLWAGRTPTVLGGVAVLAAMLGSNPATAAGLNSGPWPMFHRSLLHEGRTFGNLPSNGAIAWSASVADTVEFSSPVVDANGTIYAGTQGKDLYALNPNGSVKWIYPTLGNIRYSTPAVADDGTVYVGSADSKLYAINANGTLKWTFTTGGAVKTAPAIASDGTIYAGSDDRKMWAVNPNGTLKWSYTTTDTIRSSPCVGADGAIYFGNNAGKIFALNPTGTLRWQVQTGGPVKASPAIGQGGDIIVGSYDGFLYALRSTGTLDWVIFTGDQVRNSAAIGIHGKIYLPIGTKFYCYHDKGDTAWIYDMGTTEILSSPAVKTFLADSAEVAVFGADNGRVYAVNRGVLVWQSIVGSPVRTAPAIANDHVYVGSLNGFVHSIGAPVADVSDGGVSGLRLIASPNPFTSREATTVRLLGALPGQAARDLIFVDAAGREVRRVEISADDPAIWDGRDDAGRELPSGVYLYRLDGQSTGGRVVRVR